MTEIQGISKEMQPVGLLNPLEARGPVWLSFSLGTVISSAASVGMPAVFMLLLGHSLPVFTMAAVGGFLLLSLFAALMLCSPGQRTGSNLFACQFGVGHTLLLCLLAAAYFVPGGKEASVSVIQQVPFLAELPIASTMIGAIAPLYLLAFFAYSCLAPISFLLFRYLSLTPPNSRTI